MPGITPKESSHLKHSRKIFSYLYGISKNRILHCKNTRVIPPPPPNNAKSFCKVKTTASQFAKYERNSFFWEKMETLC